MKNKSNMLLSLVALFVVLSVKVAVSRPWEPLVDAVPNLIALYDASDGATVLTTGITVTNWLDKSANGYDLDSQSNKVYFDGYLINGLTAIKFNYIGNIKRTGIPSTNLSEVCLITVGEKISGYGDDTHFGRLKSTDGTDVLQIWRKSGNNNLKAIVETDSTRVDLTTPNDVSLAEDTPFIGAAYYDGDKGYVRANGGLMSSTNDLPNGLTFTLNEITAGRLGNTANSLYGEMIVLNSSNIGMIEKVEGYLAWKWGTVDKLPVDHPYKNAAPEVPPAGTAIIIR